MRYQRVTGATLGLAFDGIGRARLGGGRAGIPADPGQSQLRRPGAEHPQRGETDQGPGRRQRAVRGTEPDPDHPQLLLAGKHEGQLHLPHSQGRRRLPAHPPAQRLGPGHGARYSSGYTQGSIGFGFDVAAFNEIALGAARARIGGGGNRTLANSDGEAIGEWSKLGVANIRLRASNTEFKAGRFLVNLRCSAISTTVPCPPASPASP